MTKNQFGPQGWTPELMENQKGKTFLITGANSGTGFEASKILLQKNAEVIMLNRNETKTKEAIKKIKEELGENIKLSFIKLDLGDIKSIKQAVKEIKEKVEKIDALICNGAIGQVAKQTFTPDGFESQLGINYYGNFILTNLLFDKIEENNARIVYVSSEGYKLGLKKIQFEDMNFDKNYHPNNVYSQSKLALMMFAYELQNHIKKSNKNTKIYVCHPGSSKTSFIRENASLMTRIAFKIMTFFPIVQSAEKGSYPEIMCATQKDLKQKAFYGPTGFMNFVGPVGECKLEDLALNQEVMKKLWKETEKATKIKWEF